MSDKIARRALMGAAGAAVVAGTLGRGASAQAQEGRIKIVGFASSPRKGMTTAAGVTVCLEAAQEHNPNIETELIDLADYSIPAQLAAGLPLREGEVDDFPEIAEKLRDPAVAGIIVGSPVYYNTMSGLCKAFIDRCGVFRSAGFELRNKVVGALAVGGVRNGGQELTVQAIQSAMMGQEVVICGTGVPTGRIGATLWNQGDSIEGDEFGLVTARGLGQRVAELAVALHS